MLTAGMDTDCGSFMSADVVQGLLDDGSVDVALVDVALKNLFRVQVCCA